MWYKAWTRAIGGCRKMETIKADHQYPAQYEEWITIKDGSTVFLRPIKPTDGPLILDIFQKLSPETIYFRFLTHLDRLKPELLKQLVEIDYETHFALAAVIKEEAVESIIGTCRYIVKSNTDHAELTITLRNDWQRRGLGKIMAQKVVAIARSKGISSIEILFDSRNEGMKRLFASLGYPVKYESSLIDIADRMEIYLKEIAL
jgi:RimJ/RimL family protein N-acetyltransferase